MRKHTTSTYPFGLQSCLIILFIAWQIAFFAIHYHVSDLMDSLANTSIAHELFHFSIILPIFVFILIQIAIYVLIVFYIYFIAAHIQQQFRWNQKAYYWFSMGCFALAVCDLLAFNTFYFPLSFFAFIPVNPVFIWLSSVFWVAVTVVAYLQYFLDCFGQRTASQRRETRQSLGWVFLFFAAVNLTCLAPPLKKSITASSQPNIILIGLDSLRPDYTSFYGSQAIHTPHIDQFLQQATVFDNAYTPLARTYTSWMSILTAEYPKHNGIRNNLADRNTLTSSESLAKKLQQAGYYTLYASDEKRFSNILPQDGFDQVAGPSMGVNDFILGSLSDFPLANLLTKLPVARYLLPYNYANRAAMVTYEPEQFIHLMTHVLANRPNQPLFLAVHLCITHWPFTWASSAGQNQILPQQYANSVTAIDEQFGQLLNVLQKNHLLNNSIVVLLSDHGTSLGLPHDTVLDKKYYQGNQALLKNISVSRYSNTPPDSTDFKKDYSINTVYGQGTNVTSLKQYHTLLAFRRYGENHFQTTHVQQPVSLIDIGPTLLTALQLPTFAYSDGISLVNVLHGNAIKKIPRAFYLETGDSLSEIETDHIYLEKVVEKKIGIYRIDASTGLLIMDPIAEKSINDNKQRAVIWGDWLLAHFPASARNKLVTDKKTGEGKLQPFTVPDYYVLVNLKTKRWTIGLNDAFAKHSPADELRKKLKEFYGDEI